MKYKVKHTTKYKYQGPVNVCHNRLCLGLIETSSQKVISSKILITPEPDETSNRKDFFGNNILFFSIYKVHSNLEIVSESEVVIQHHLFQELAQNSLMLWEDACLEIEDAEFQEDLVQFILPSNFVPYKKEIRDFAQISFPKGATLWDACFDLMQRIFNEIKFTPGFTTINTPVETVLKAKRGVCQDFAHLMIACVRNMGLPARYVSGYIETLPPPDKPKLVGSDASHAWVSIYFPSIGWVDFDPTNCLLPAFQHIVIAYGRDYQDIAPVKGIVFGSGDQVLSLEVDVERIS